MRTGRPKAELILSDEERSELESLARRRRSASALAQRARMVLACAAGQDNKAVARRVRVAPATVGKWRRRFIEDRVAGLMDEPRPGAPRQITDKQIEDVIVRTLESTPKGATHWSTRDMAKATGLSAMTISRIWRAFGLLRDTRALSQKYVHKSDRGVCRRSSAVLVQMKGWGS